MVRGILGKEESWVLVGFPGVSGEMWVVFDGGRKACLAGSLGEIGRPILKDSPGVLSLGLLQKEEVDVLRFSVDFSGRKGLSLAGGHSLGSFVHSGIHSLIFLLSFPPVFHLDFPPSSP